MSTNVAETSVTLDGVRFVIDSGAVKEAGSNPNPDPNPNPNPKPNPNPEPNPSSNPNPHQVKEAGFDAEQSLSSLSPHWVSRASADQRKGRAGRTGPGVCFRLYSQGEYDALDAFTPPALLRTPLEVSQSVSQSVPSN